MTAGWDDSAKLWDTKTGKLSRDLGRFGWVYSAAFSHDGSRIFIGNITGKVELVEAATGRRLQQLLQQEGQLLALAVSPDDSTILAGSTDATARLWKVSQAGRELAMRHRDKVSSIAFIPDGRKLLTGSDDYTARLWDVESGTSIGKPMQHENRVSTIAYSPDGRTALTASLDQSVCLWDTQTGSPVYEPSKYKGVVYAVKFLSNKDLILATADGAIVRLQDFPLGRLLGEMIHDQNIYRIAFSPVKNVLATASRDLNVRLWDIRILKYLSNNFATIVQ